MAKKDNKRELILEAAFRLFLVKGLGDTKMIDIANEAGIGKGTIYEYFSSKEELFETLFEQKVISAYQRIDEVLAQKTTAKSKLMAYVSFDSTLTKNMPVSRDVINNLMIDSSSHCSSPARTCIKRLMDYRFSILYDIISDGIKNGEFISADPMMASVAVMGSMAFYLSFNFDFFPGDALTKYQKRDPWKDDEFVGMLLGGLCAQTDGRCPAHGSAEASGTGCADRTDGADRGQKADSDCA